MKDLLSKLQPYIALISAVASLAVLTYLVQLLNLIRGAFSEQVNAVREQKSVTEARLKQAEEDLARTEKWHQREVATLQVKLAALLGGENITVEKLIATGGQLELGEEIKQDLKSVLNEISVLKDVLPKHPEVSPEPPSALLDMAKGFSAAKDWGSAADFYSQYLKSDPENWEIHFLKAVALANSREGEHEYRLAVAELGAAIAFAPIGLENNKNARIIAYRGAVLKRLGRLEEAESDLLVARKMATAEYELEDIGYNLSCIYSMMKRRDDMFRYLQPLAANAKWRDYVRHRKEYFSNYWEDPEFRSLVGLDM
jgi:tetratricopeptide (TPR) repeat protein